MTGAGATRARRAVPVRALLLIVALLALSAGVAAAFWSAGSAPGGSGAAAATQVDQGATPTATVESDGTTITVAWAAGTLAGGGAVSGYQVRRYPAGSPNAATMLTDCAGTVVQVTCSEGRVPTGSWAYTVTPLLAVSWRGPESERSAAVSTESTPPVNALTLSDLTGGAYLTSSSVYYRGVSAGTFTLTNAVSDEGSGPASSTTSALTGSTSGWTHTPSTVSAPAEGPFVSNPFSWAPSTSGSPSEAVTARDNAGSTTTTVLTFIDDSTAPAGGAVSSPDGYQTTTTADVLSSAGTDAGSGIATGQLQRSSAALAAGLCDTFTAFADLGPDSPPSTYTDASLSDQRCYRYRFVVTDRVGNQQVSTTPHEVKVDSGSGAPLLRASASYSVLAGTGVANTGLTTVSGDLGVSPSGSVAGFSPGIVSGTTHAGDAAAAQGQADLVAAYSDAQGRPATSQFAGDLNGRTFTAGVHHTSAALALTGTVTLDAQGDPSAVFIFQVDAAMNAAAASSVALVNGAQPSHVFWQVQGAVGAGADASLSGTLLAAGAITLGAGTHLIGRALSYGTVTMSTNAVRFTVADPPTLTIAGGDTAVTKDTTPTLLGTTSAPPGTTVRVAVAGQSLVATVAADGTWGVTAGTLADGVQSVTATVRDLSGNSGGATQSLTVEVNPGAVDLRSAASYSVLAGVGVANTGATTISGDLGISPGTALTGFPPGTVSGDVHAGDAAAAAGRADVETLYADLDSRTPRSSFSGDLNGRTFHGGVYHTAAALALTGTVTLDAEGDPNAVFVFQVDAAMNTAAGSNVALVNGAQAAHVFWQVQGAVGTGATTAIAGTIVTAGGVTLGAGTQLIGRALSYGTVTLASNTIRFTTSLPPSLTITGGSPAVTKDTTPTIAGTTDAVAGTAVRVTVAGQRLVTTAAADGSWSVTAAALTAGAHVVTASVTDQAGNSGRATQSLTVEVNPASVDLRSAASYSVLAANAVANTGLTTVAGDLGVTTVDTITGFPPGIVSGTTHNADASAHQAQSDLSTAYADAEGRAPGDSFSGDLVGRTFRAGVHHTSAAVALTGTVTLDGENDPESVFIFQVDGAMNTAAGSQVALVNGAQAANVFWQVQGAVGTGANASLSGTVLTPAGITLGDGTVLHGRALSSGTVTLATSTIGD